MKMLLSETIISVTRVPRSTGDSDERQQRHRRGGIEAVDLCLFFISFTPRNIYTVSSNFVQKCDRRFCCVSTLFDLTGPDATMQQVKAHQWRAEAGGGDSFAAPERNGSAPGMNRAVNCCILTRGPQTRHPSRRLFFYAMPFTPVNCLLYTWLLLILE